MIASTFYLKALDSGARSPHLFSDVKGSTTWTIGAWKPDCRLPERPPLRPHYYGYHLGKLEHAASWFHRENFLAEARGEIVEGWDCIVSSEARLVKHMPMHDDDWSSLVLDYAREVVDLPLIMRFPHDMIATLRGAFDAVEHWMLTGENGAKAHDLCQLCFAVAGRNRQDSDRSYEYMSNSMALFYAASAVASLVYLHRADGRRLAHERTSTSETMKMLEGRTLREIWQTGLQSHRIPRDNYEVCRDVSGFAAKAAEASVRQLEFFVGRGRDDALQLSAQQKKWIKRSLMPKGASVSHHAVSGIRAIQNDFLLKRFRIALPA